MALVFIADMILCILMWGRSASGIMVAMADAVIMVWTGLIIILDTDVPMIGTAALSAVPLRYSKRNLKCLP